MDPTVNPNKPSGIPRPSRLPILRSKTSQVFTKTPVTAEPSEAISATPRTHKRAPVVKPPQSGYASIRGAPASVPSTTRTAGPNGAKLPQRPLTGPRTMSARPSSRGNQQRVAPNALDPARTDYEENQDRLGPIEGFRTASRQGYRDEEVFETVEYVEPPEPADMVERKRSRPSLSDRTIESLQGMPATPKGRRRSSFFLPVESPMGPPQRPPSAMSRNGSSSSRPGTSDGQFTKPTLRSSSPAKKAPASAKPVAKIVKGGFGLTPKLEDKTRRSVSTVLTSRAQESKDHVPASPRAVSPSKRAINALSSSRSPGRPLGASKTVAVRPVKARPTLGDAFAPTENRPAAVRNGTVGASTEKSTQRTISNPTGSNTSTALREQIAAAKAAARKERAKHDSPQQAEKSARTTFEADSHADPFNLAPKDAKHVLRNRIRTAWTDGKLNIAAMGLKEIPEEVLHMYDTKAMEDSHVNWAEVVDLTKLIAADNEFEVLDGKIFPDASAETFERDEESEGNQFGGLELLDLHNNYLQSLPMGLRRLERLTHLNLTNNKLENSVLEIVSQISSLKDLKLGNNALGGHLSTTICSLSHLECLDLQSNRLLGLPEAMRELTSLRVLNVAGNQLTAVPMDALQHMPLVELNASSNVLIGSLFPLGGSSTHATLQTLNVANNSLAALTFSETIDLPALRTMDVTNNHLTMLSPLSGCEKLITLTAGDNKFSDLPIGFAALQQLRNVNFTGNDIRTLDPLIANMDSLESLILAANPLREKKYLNMSAADIKKDLRSRLEPAEIDAGELSDPEMVIDTGGDTIASATSKWILHSNGRLNLSSKNLSDDVNDTLGSFLRTNEVKELLLSSNKLTSIPPALWLGQDLRILDLSNNVLGSDYFSADFELPVLQELNLSHCRLTTLDPLTSQLTAPALHTLHLTANRLSGPLPSLRTAYPALTTLQASDNKFTSLSAQALQGLQIVNVASNDVEALPAEIGLLWDQGLRSLVVTGNAFRVPNYRILEKGTEATMRWLREKLPAGAIETSAGTGGRDDEF